MYIYMVCMYIHIYIYNVYIYIYTWMTTKTGGCYYQKHLGYILHS